MKNKVVPLVSILSVFALVVCSFILSVYQKDQLAKQQTILQNLSGEYEKNNKIVKNDIAKKQEKTTGLKEDRYEKDSKIINNVLTEMLNWNGFAEYDAVYESLAGNENIEFSDEFFDSFFPRLSKSVDVDGNVTYRDKDAMYQNYENNLSFAGNKAMDVYVLDIDDRLTYTYLVRATVTSDFKGRSEDGTCIFIMKVTKEGKIKDLEGYSIRVN